MPETIHDLSKLCVHTQTNKPWGLEECIQNYAAAGIHALSIWRHLLEDLSFSRVRSLLMAHEMKVVSLVRGGFFASVHPGKREAAVEDNRLAIEQLGPFGCDHSPTVSKQ